MRLPIPFLLYVTALGLFGWTGWTVYQSLDLWSQDALTAATTNGRNQALDLLARGKGKGQGDSGDWNYRADGWWKQFKQFSRNDPQGVNLIGRILAPEPSAADLAQQRAEQEKPKVDMTPLEDIFELVYLAYDGTAGGKGGKTHVIIRYKPTANVQPPEWWVRENTPPTPGGATPPDVVARTAERTGRLRGNRGRGGRPPTQPAVTSMPTTSVTGREILQSLWLDTGDDERRSPQLWPEYGHIKLVRVASDCKSAFFVREMPPPADGEPAPEPKEEELLKTTADIPQDVLLAVRKLQGREGEARSGTSEPTAQSPQWRETDETTRFGNAIHIGRKDERRFRENADTFFNNVYVDTYVSRSSDMRGLQVRNIDPQIAQRFGVQTGEVLLEINGRAVDSKAQAMQRVKKDYNRGVRTFATKWLSNGQIVERTYQAPDK